MGRDDGVRTGHRVVFDFDGVLSHRDTMGWFVRRRLLDHPARMPLALPVVVTRKLLLRFAFHRSWTSRLLVRMAMAGLTVDGYVLAASAAGREMARRDGFAVADGFAALRGHLARGDTVVVATGSEYHVVRAFLDELGVTGVTLLTSTVDPTRRHVALHHYCVGRQKLADVRQSVGDVADIDFYTDSTDDLPLARVATRTHLINPDRRTMAAYRQWVPAHQILRWEPVPATAR